MNNIFVQAIEILDEAIKILNSYNTDISLSDFDSEEGMFERLQELKNQLSTEDNDALKELYHLFAPTGPLYQFAVNSDWPDQYYELADRMEYIYKEQNKI